MALINCSIDSASTTVAQGQGNITSQVLYISPDSGWVISATNFRVANRTYSQNSNSLTFTNGVNGVVLDAAIYSITLADTTTSGLADNKIKVTVDLTGYIMPGTDTTLIIDIDGDGEDASLINLRAVLLEPDLLHTTTTITAGSLITYVDLDEDSAPGLYDRNYFTTESPIEPGVQIKLATVTIQVNTGSYPNYQITPVSLAGVDGSFEGTDKFEILNIIETYNSDNLLQTYKFDLMFTDDVDLNDNAWGSDYNTTGQYFPNVTTRLLFSSEEVTIPSAGHDVDSALVSGSMYHSGFSDIYDYYVIPSDGSLGDDKLTVTGDGGATFDVDIVEDTVGGAFESLPNFPASFTLPSGPGKTSVDIPVEFTTIGSVVEKTFTLTATATNGATMGIHTAPHGSRNNTNTNNSSTIKFGQHKDPTISVVGLKEDGGGSPWTWVSPGPQIITPQVGKALTSVESLSWRSDAKGNTSVDFTIQVDNEKSGGFTIIKAAPIGFTSGDENKDSDFTEDSTDHGNTVVIRNLTPSIEANTATLGSTSTIGKLSGTIDFKTYGIKDVTFTIDLKNIFSFTAS